MKRLAFAISAAAALGFSACEMHPSAELPEHYQHKGNHGDAAGHEAAPAPGGAEKAPAEAHKS